MQPLVKANEAPYIDLKNGSGRRILAYNQDTMLVEVHFEKGAVGSDHTHPHAQISYVQSGKFTYRIEDKTYTMEAGDSIAVEGGQLHGCACEEAGVLLDIFAPMREDFVK